MSKSAVQSSAQAARATPPSRSGATDGDNVDGRRARRDRNRERVVDALLGLYREGKLAPSISLVAKRSGVSHRSVFRYFEDLDQLCRVAMERHALSVSHLLEIDNPAHGSLGERIDALIRCRINLYEAAAPVARVTRMRAPLQPILEERLVADRRRLDSQVTQQFASELEALPKSERTSISTAVQVICSHDSLELMRHSQGLSADQTASVIRVALWRLLDPGRGVS